MNFFRKLKQKLNLLYRPVKIPESTCLLHLRTGIGKAKLNFMHKVAQLREKLLPTQDLEIVFITIVVLSTLCLWLVANQIGTVPTPSGQR